MAVSYGFYNSSNHDRVYNASHLGELFDGIIVDGVFNSIGQRFRVRKVDGEMQVTVGTGKAWFHKTWTVNDAEITKNIDAASSSNPRIDAIVIQVDETNRTNSIIVVKGTPASSPSRPALTNDNGVYQLPLAYVRIPKNATSITSGNITSVVGTEDCPYVTGPLTSLDTTDAIAKFENKLDSWITNMESVLNAEYPITEVTSRLAALETKMSAIYDPAVWRHPYARNARVTNILGGIYRVGNRVYVQLECEIAKVIPTGEGYLIMSTSSSGLPDSIELSETHVIPLIANIQNHGNTLTEWPVAVDLMPGEETWDFYIETTQRIEIGSYLLVSGMVYMG